MMSHEQRDQFMPDTRIIQSCYFHTKLESEGDQTSVFVLMDYWLSRNDGAGESA